MQNTLFPVPFYPQKWDLSRWKELGYESEEDARYWERSCCGILCLQMAAEFFLNKKYKTIDLIKKGIKADAYTDRFGWSHEGLCRLTDQLGLMARRSVLTPIQLAEEIEKGRLPIISIKWGFRRQKSAKERLLFWKKYGGHLALVIGTQWDGKVLEGFYVHHTSIREGYDWPARFIALKQFKQGYTGRAITIACT